MKKFWSRILAAVLLLSLCACASQGSEETAFFQVGYGKADITYKDTSG